MGEASTSSGDSKNKPPVNLNLPVPEEEGVGCLAKVFEIIIN